MKKAAQPDKKTKAPGKVIPLARESLGGYTDRFVVNERFAIVFPKIYPLEKAGPLLC